MGIKEDITKIYVGYYDRAPDPAGLNYWIGRANAGMTLSEIANSFAVQAESTAKYPYLANPHVASADSFIDSVYMNLFNRAPDAAGKAYWLAQLAGGKPVGQMIIDIMSGAKDDANGKDKTILDNKVAVGVDFAEDLSTIGGLDYENNPAAKTAAADALKGVTDDASTVASAKATTDAIVASGDLAPKGSFVLTTGADAGAAFTGGPGTDVFTATEATLSSADALDGGAGNDTLNYASSGTAAVNEAGFTTQNIENINVTADAVAGTTFDATGVTGAKKLANVNSSANLTVNGASEKVDLELKKVSGGNTTLNYDATLVAGATDEQNIALNGNVTSGNTAIGSVMVNGVETFNVSSTGAASKVSSLAGNALTKMVVTGDKDLDISSQSFVGTTNELDASAFTGKLNVTMGNTGAVDVVVKGGTGDDMADFSNGFDAGDSFDGGAGVDTLGLSTAVATGTPAGTVANVEKLNISDAGGAGAATVDMDNFAGVTEVNFDGGLGGNRTVGDAVTGIKVGVDAPAGQNLTVALKTDGSADEVTVDLDELAAGSSVGTLTANEAETLNISADDHTTDGTGTLTIGTLSATDATTIKLSGDAMVTINNTADPATPVLTTFDASAMTDGVSLSGTNFAAGGSTVKFGSGDDTYNVATSAGADTITLGGGKDKVVYTAVAQSSAAKVDTITDFVSGTDVIDVTALLGAAPTLTSFVGVFSNFGAAQGALTGGGTQSATFDSSTGTLWVDANGDGTLDSNDLQVILSGVTNITAADLALAGGNTIDLTAPAAVVNLTTNTNATAKSTNSADTITASTTDLVGSSVDGLLGTDTMTVSGTAAAGETAGLTTANTQNIETVVIDSSVEDVSVDAATLAANAGGEVATLTGASGTLQSLTAGTGTDLTGTTISNIEVLNQTGTVSMTAAQHNAFGGIVAGGGADQINLSGAGNVIGNAAIETYRLSSTNGQTFTVGTAAQNVIEFSATTNVNVGSLALTGTYTSFDGTDTFIATNGVNFTGANAGAALGAGSALNLTGNATMTTSQLLAFLGNITGNGTNAIVATDSGGVNFVGTLDASIESLDIQNNDANVVTLGSAGQSIDTGTNTTTVNINGLTATGTFASDGNDTFVLTNGANISGATFTGIGAGDAFDVAAGAGVTLTNAQYDQVETAGVTTSAAGNNSTFTFSDVAVGQTDIDEIDHYIFASGNNTFTVTLADAETADRELTLSAGGNDVITITNASIDAAGTSVVEISGFSAADDKIDTALITGAYVTADAGNKITGQAGGNVIEIHSTGANGVSIGSPTSDASLLASLNQVLTNGGTAADMANGNYTVVGYNGADAFVYEVTIAGGNGTAGGDDVVELIGSLSGVGADALGAVNFI